MQGYVGLSGFTGEKGLQGDPGIEVKTIFFKFNVKVFLFFYYYYFEEINCMYFMLFKYEILFIFLTIQFFLCFRALKVILVIRVLKVEEVIALKDKKVKKYVWLERFCQIKEWSEQDIL